MVPDRADTWTRMAYAGPNKPIAPVADPYQMFAKLYGRMRDQANLRSILDDLQEDLGRVAGAVSAEDRRLLDEHATFVREMEQDLRPTSQNLGHAVPQLEPNIRRRVPAFLGTNSRCDGKWLLCFRMAGTEKCERNNRCAYAGTSHHVLFARC